MKAMIFRKDLLKPPQLRGEHGAAAERHATWLELFYDLVFVAAVSQLATSLSEDYSTKGVLQFAALFVPVWWAWAGHTFYLSRFDSEDLLHRLLTMAQMTAAAAMAASVATALGNTSTGFAISYAVVRGILVAEYIRAGLHIPAVRPLTNRYVAGFGLAAFLWFLSIFLPPPWRFLLWGVALVIDFIAPLTAGTLHVRFPPHLMHLPERFGLFTIIVIGEAVVSVVVTIAAKGLDLATGAAGCMGLVVAFALWWGYFEGAQGAKVRQLSGPEHVRNYQQWLYSHLPLVMGITSTTVGVRHIIASGPWSVLHPGEGWLLCLSVGVSVLSLNSIFLASFPPSYARKVRHFITPYLVIALLGIGTGFLGEQLAGIYLLAILTLLCLVQIIYSLREVSPR